jgi:hypothetical protein
MLNASVKGVREPVFTFHSIVAPAEKTADLTAVMMTTLYKSSLYQFKNKESFDPNQRIIES